MTVLLSPALLAAIERTLRHEPQLHGEFRTRYERRLDRDFKAANTDNRSDFGNRFRLSAAWQVEDKVRLFVEYQYSHALVWTAAKNASTDHSDIFQAYAAVGLPKGALTLGRQTVQFSSSRLLASSDWGEVGRSFDGARYKDDKVDVLVAKVGAASPHPRFARIAAAGYQWSGGTTAVIFKHDEVGASTIDTSTFDHAAKGHSRGIDWEAEAALQLGRTGHRDVEAWAYHLRGQKTLGARDKVGVELNVASGGQEPGTNRTYDSLFFSSHRFFWKLDMQGWKNVNLISADYDHAFSQTQNLRFRGAYTSLRDASDAWYGGNGNPNKRNGGVFQDPTGLSGRDLGWELDVEFGWKPAADCQATLGCSIFFPGRFVRSLSGENRPQQFAYLMVTKKF